MLECDFPSRTSEKGAEAAIYGDVSLRISENRLRMDVALSRQGPGFESLTEHYSDRVLRGSEARTEGLRITKIRPERGFPPGSNP